MTVHQDRPRPFGPEPIEPPRGLNLRPVGQRLASLLRGANDPDERLHGAQPAEWVEDEQWPAHEDVQPRFPVVRHGYDCTAVDVHVAELEQELAELDSELAELRTQGASQDVANEIKRVGEQTSAVLIAANEQRGEILRVAREEADRCVAEATAEAGAITAQGEARLRELQAQHETALRERDRLLEEVRAVSAALAALADPAGQRTDAPPAA
jgi:hypothetical protein